MGSVEANKSPDGEVKRRWERMEYQATMALVFEDGRRIEGQTLDVGLGGVFLECPAAHDTVAIGEMADLHIIDRDDEPVFPCTVARITEAGIGINFTGHRAAFGMFVSHDMMLDLLTSINNAFAASLDLEQTLQTSVSHIKNYLQSEAASLFLVDENRGDIQCSACSGPVDISGTRLKIGEGVVGRVISEGTTVVVNDVVGDSYFSSKVDEATGFKTESLICAPLRIKDKTIGALEVINKRGSGLFAGHDRVVLTALASATAMAVHNARQAEAVSERDAARQASREKSEFLSSMSHELRTPLNAILGFAQLLEMNQDDNLSDNQKTAVDSILKGGGHLLSLINEILDLAKIESGKLEFTVAEMVPEDAIHECLEMAEKLAEGKSIALIDNSEARTLPLIWVDAGRFKQVLLNLLSNAIKYNHQGGTVTVSSNITADDMLRLTVTDTGPGITKERQELLFQPFVRLGMEGGAEEGAGIGLTISKNLVELMSGRIGFESHPGQGSSFWIDFPTAGT